MSRYLCLLFVSVLLCQGVFAKPASKDSVLKLMKTTGALRMNQTILDQMLPALKQMAPDVPQNFWNDFVASVDPNELTELIIPIYQKHLSEEDIIEINRFYESKAGQNLIRVQPAMIRESMAMGQRWGNDIAQRIIQKYRSSPNQRGL